MSQTAYRIVADAVLAAHFSFVAFVVLGLILVLVGGARGWDWVRSPAFRICHLAAIGIVMLQAWAGVACPLTTLEMLLRRNAGEATYTGSFIAHWLERALYYEAPPWVFATAYTLFALLVAAAWLTIPPHRRTAAPTHLSE